jgi:hypothetical protein
MSTMHRLPTSRALDLVLVLCLAAALTACGGAAASFDPTGACSGDGAAPGAYPDLEALIPATFEGQAHVTLDSGRNCSAENLGSLRSAGFDEIRFAGGTWDFGGNRAAALAVFSAPGLDADSIADFFTESASAANRTNITGRSQVTMAGTPVHRMDSTTGDRLQTVVVWQGTRPDVVNVVITNDLPDPKIESAVAAFTAP